MDIADYKQVSLNKRTLVFPSHIEQMFLLERLPSKLFFFRTVIIVFCCLNLTLQYICFNRFMVVPSLFLLPLPAMILFWKFRPDEQRIDLLCGLSLFFMSLSVLGIMVYLPNTLSKFPVLFLLMISGFVLFKIRYLFIGLTGFFLNLAFGACLVFFTDAAPVSILYQTFFLISLTVFGVLSAYAFEYYTRMFFLKSSIYEQTLRENKKNETLLNEELIRTNKSLELEIFAHLEAESQLKESEEKYRNLVISLPEGIFIVQDQKIVFLNPSMERLTGYKSEELLGEDAQILFAKRKKTGSKGNNDYLESFTRRDGQVIFIEKSFVEIRYGSSPALLYSLRDITEKITATRNQKRLKNKLERAKRMEAFGILAGGVAHDLNNVLAGLVSGPEALLMDIPPGSPLTAHVETIKDSGKRALNIAEELLTMVRGAAMTLNPLRLNDVIEDYFFSPEFDMVIHRYPDVKIIKELDVELPLIEASDIHIRKIVMNLVSNAVESAGPENGSVFVYTSTVEFSNQRIQGYEKIKSGRFIKLCVMNTGKGISSEDIDHIFEPFYSKKVLGKSGTGLGLSIVWNAVHDHNGYIHVSSKNSKTYFTLYFPVSEMIENTLPVSSQVCTLEDYSGNGENILVVDDMPEQQTIAMNMLKRLGYDPYTVSSGEEAIEYIRQTGADLVLLDMVMDPGINGLETYEQLKVIDPEIKAVFTSGYATEESLENARNIGVDGFVKKPYSLEKLGVAVKKEFLDKV